MLLELAEYGAIVLERDSESPTWASAYTTASLPRWRLSEPFSDAKDLRSQLLSHARLRARAESEDESVFTLWRELAIAECVGYLASELSDHRFDEGWALAAVPAIDRGLRRMPASHISYLCWLAVRDAASRYLRFPAAVGTLAEGLVTYIDGRIDRAISQQWAIRDWIGAKRGASAVAEVFADHVTDLGPSYLTRVPARTTMLRAPQQPRRRGARRAESASPPGE